MAEINMDDFKPNSRKYHQEQEEAEALAPAEKKIEKVIQGSGTKKKRSLGRIFVDTFIDGNVQDVKTYLIEDVIVPAIKENFADLVNSTISMLLFGEAMRRTPRKQGNGTGSKVNYGGYFNTQKPERLPRSDRSRMARSFDDVYFDSRGEAELVRDGMLEALDVYKQVTVADFYDLAGVTTEFTDNKFGWVDLRGIEVRRSPRYGYYIVLPKCIPLE